MEGNLFFDLSAQTQEEKPAQDQQIVIIGGGAAGLTAAIYAGRAMLSPLVITGEQLGGQTATTDEIENYPGFPDGVGGMDLIHSFQRQAERFGARVVFDIVTEVDFTQRPFTIKTYSETYAAQAVIVATGASPRKLDVPGESRLIGRGVSYCATCDGHFYRDKPVLVVGGGDSAIDESLYLSRIASKVTVIHRRDQLRANKTLQKRAFENPKIEFVWDSVVEEILGEETMTGARVRNVKTGEIQTLQADGIFIYIGMLPNTQLFQGQLELDDQGYIITDKRQRTNIPGVFAAGDVQDPHFRQVVIAAGTGAAAAMEAERFLSTHGNA